jgi:phospholipid-binding lipoprotein MlaA
MNQQPCKWARRALFSSALALLVGAAGCATPPTDRGDQAEFEQLNDPLEPTNREIHAVDLWLDDKVLHPVADAYVDVVPPGAREGIHNVLSNLGEPVIAFNDLLQGNATLAWTATRRFAINATVGVVGVFDVASDLNLPRHNADFGQTFGVWGIEEGPYIYLPVLGPSNARDATGLILTALTNPLIYVGGAEAAVYAETATQPVDERSRRSPMLDELRADSLDYYAALRAVYRQHRAHRIEQARSRSRVQVEFGYPVPVDE